MIVDKNPCQLSDIITIIVGALLSLLSLFLLVVWVTGIELLYSHPFSTGKIVLFATLISP